MYRPKKSSLFFHNLRISLFWIFYIWSLYIFKNWNYSDVARIKIYIQNLTIYLSISLKLIYYNASVEYISSLRGMNNDFSIKTNYYSIFYEGEFFVKELY